jgi:alkylation response protein AidB-like acyl-CoA dehydrogenase
MDFDLSEEQMLFRETTAKFLQERLPLTRVRSFYGHSTGYEHSVWREGAALGWTSAFVPEEHGGGSVSGQSFVDIAIAAEEFGRAVAPGPLLPVNVVAATIARSGSTVLQKSTLPGLLTGELIATWCRADQRGRWIAPEGPVNMVVEGDDFVLSGTAAFVEAAESADLFLVTAESNSSLAQFIVRADEPGLSIKPRNSLDFVKRFGDVHFEQVRVGPSEFVGEITVGAEDATAQLDLAVLIDCAETMGAFERVFELTLEYVSQRITFGRSVASYQAIKHRLANIKMAIEAGHAGVAATARALQQNSPDASELASAAKAYLATEAVAGVQDCIQMHGGIGVTWEHDAHIYLRRIVTNCVLYGGPNEHRDRLCSLAGL